jgi:RNA polymerase sigma-70 factor (ECF subfamily)
MPLSTRESLIARIMHGDEIAWQDFESLYRPLLLMRGKDRGLNPEEQQDLVQDVMVSVFKAKERFVYRSEKGSFRAYLKKIADRRAFDVLRKRQPRQEDYQELEEQGVFVTSSSFEDMERRWERAWRSTQIKEALALVKAEVTETTYRAFWMCVIDGVDAAATARSLDISIESVYVAKHRTLKRLRLIIRRLEELDQ